MWNWNTETPGQILKLSEPSHLSIRIGIIDLHTHFLPGSKEVQSVKVLGNL